MPSSKSDADTDNASVFRLYTDESWTRLLDKKRRHEIRKANKPLLQAEGKLVDGELQFEDEEAQDRDRNLKEGKVLADHKFGKIPPEIIGKPIEEIDEHIEDKTFVVINTRFRENYIFRFSATNAFFIFRPINPIRKFCLTLITNSFFDYFIMATILVNSAFLTLTTEYPPAEYTFLAIYTLEMLLKLVARGFFLERHTYIRDPWNFLDIVIVISSYAMIIVQFVSDGNNVNISVLRTFRVFRVLKTFSIIPGLKSVIGALLKSMRMFLEVLILIFFVLSIFSLFALQVYKGLLRNKCIQSVDWTNIDLSTTNQSTIDAYYHWYIKQEENWMSNGADGYMLCGNNSGAGRCENSATAGNKSWVCLSDIGDNMNYGLTSYDNFGMTMMSCLQLLTLDHWEEIYGSIIRTDGTWNVLFFIIEVFVGSFYLINLMVAVVTTSYEEQVKRANKDKIDNERAMELHEMKEEQRKRLQERKELALKKRLIAEEEQLSQKKMSIKRRRKISGLNKNDDAKTGSRTGRKKSFVHANPFIEIQNKENGLNEEDSSYNVNEAGRHEISDPDPIFDQSINIPIMQLDSGFNSQDLEDSNSIDKAKIVNKDKNVVDSPIVVMSDGKEYIDRNCSCCSRNCHPFIMWIKIQNSLFFLVTDPLFELLITLSIFVNTILMTTDRYPMPATWDTIFDISNTIFTAIFILEAILKLIALGKEYFDSGWNIFDLIVVLTNILDLSVAQINGFSIIRVFRLFRVFKLARSWKAMRQLLNIIFSSISAVGNISLIMFIVLFIFAVIGMQLFRGSYTKEVFGSEENIPRWNFESFDHALMLVFRILCGEFVESLIECMRANGAICMVVFYPTLILGHCMVLSLFLALLLSSFGSKSTNEDEEEPSSITLIVKRLRGLLKLTNQIDDSEGKIKEFETSNESSETSSSTTDDKNSFMTTDEPKELVLEDCLCHSCYQRYNPGQCCHCCFCITCPIDQKYGEKWQIFRYELLKLSENNIFEGFILILILVSSLSLAFEDIYLDDNPTLKTALNYLNMIFAILFTLEMLMKIFAFGINLYFTSFWTILDFCIVCISWVDIIATFALPDVSQISAFRSLRTLRAFRPLRSVSRWRSMKIVVNALLYAIPSIVNVLMVSMLFWLIFSIIGVQFFKGKFFRCQDSDQNDLSYLITPNKSECLRLGYSWNNRKINFDNVGQGLLALYQVATFEGWIECMRDAVDITDVDLQPIRENSMGYYAYFVLFIVVGSFFTLNLFIGVIIDNFNDLKKKYEGNYMDMFLTPSQKKYFHTMKKLNHQKPRKTIRKPKNNFQRIFYDVAMSDKFEITIILFIFANMIAMMIEHYKQKDIYTEALEIINTIFTTIFALEAMVKIIGLRFHYFRQVWNVFDFIIVLLNIIGLIIKEYLDNAFVSATLLRVFRLFRISRLFRLITFAKGIRKLLFTLIISLPALFNIGALLALIIFIYAIIGMSVFGNVIHNNAIDDLVNFENFERSMLLLFRISTVAGWNDILDSLLVSPPNCNSTHIFRSGVATEVPNGNCGTSWLAILYCISFILLTFLIIVNVYIAIILENFGLAHEQEEVGIVEDDFESFYLIWERYDPDASQYIKLDQLSNFVADLSEPLGIPKPNTIAIITFDLSIVEGDKVHCLDVLIALVGRVLGNVQESEEFIKVKKQIDDSYRKAFPNRTKHRVVTTTLRRKKEDAAAIMLQRAWRYHKAQWIFTKMRETVSILAGKEAIVKSGGPGLQNFGSTVSLKQVSRSAKSNNIRSTTIKPPPMSRNFYQ